jgi:hypothetical protein
MKYYVYALFRSDTGTIFYIGMGSGKRVHLSALCGNGNPFKQRVISKCGEVIPVIVKDGMTMEDANDLERALILAVGRHPQGPLTNLAAGGEGCSDPSEQTRDLMSLRAKERNRNSPWEAKRKARMADPEVRAKMSAAKKGKPSPRKGAVLSEETRAKIGAANKGRIQSEEERARRKAIMSSPEVRAKLVASHLGKKNSAESKLKNSEAHRGQKRSKFDASWWQTSEGKAHVKAARWGDRSN